MNTAGKACQRLVKNRESLWIVFNRIQSHLIIRTGAGETIARGFHLSSDFNGVVSVAKSRCLFPGFRPGQTGAGGHENVGIGGLGPVRAGMRNGVEDAPNSAGEGVFQVHRRESE